jgi:hypothetical protein
VATRQNRERSGSQVGFEPGKSSVGEAKPVSEAFEKDGVVDSVKGSRQI